MLKIVAMTLACVLLIPAAGMQAGQFPQRWNYIGGSILTDDSTDKLIGLVRQSKAAGCTHVLWSGCRGFRLPELGAKALQRAGRVKAEAKKLGITIVPKVLSIGYSGRYFAVDSNLAAGIPVRNMPYLVKGRTAEPDPATALDAGKLKPESGRLVGRFKVRPFQLYRLSYLASFNPGGREDAYQVFSGGGKRWHSRTNPVVKKQGDRFFVQTMFNTLKAEQIRVVIDARKGKVEDVKIVPAGMLLILRRDWIPLKVTDASGKTVYEEGKDFKPVHDPIVAVRPFPGEFPLDHPAVPIELTDGSRIKDGQKLLVSFWHHQRVYNDQDLITLEDPQVWKTFELEIKEACRVWGTEGYMLNYDEIRVGGWERRPKEWEGLTLGQMLGRHFKKAYDLLREHAPKAKVYTWSDMFTPYHNARPFKAKGYYYLCNGNWDGSWEALPKDVIVMNWYSPDTKNTKFFAGRGHKQVLCGYYDGRTTARMKANISRWMKVSRGVPGILGVMYTTWRRDYDHLDEYFKLLETHGKWK